MLRHFLDQSKRFTFMKFFSLRLSFLTVVLTLPSVFSQNQPLSANFVVALYGANVIGTPGDPNGYGTAYLSFDTNLAILYYRIELYAITVPIAIELDSGNELQITGSAIGGNAIVDLLEVGSIQAVNSRQFVVTGAAAIDGNLILDIVRQPGFYYVVVFTVDYPNGAVRGQLMLPNAGVEVSVSDSNLDVWNGNSLGTTGVGGVGGVGTTGTALGGGLGVGAGLGAGGGLGTGAGVTGIAAGGAGLGGATGVAGGIP